MSYHSSRKLLVHASPPPIFLPSDYSPPFISSTDDATSYGRNDYGYNMQSLHFNSSIALVMVVLVTAFFFLAFLSIYIRRCAFGHLGGFNNGGEPGQQVGNRQNHSVLGVDPELIATFPLIKYSIGDNGNEEEGESTLPVGQKEQQHTECAVCLSEFEDGETLRLLPTCKHKFHQDCIDMWLFSHTTCPLCRGSVVPSTSPSLNAQVDPEPSSMLLPLQPEATIARREGSLPREGITNDSWQLASLNSSELYLVVRRLNSPGDSMRFPKSSTPIPVATSSSTSAVSGVTQAAEENNNDDDDDGERRNTARKFRRSADFGLLEQRRSESLFSSSRWRSTGISLSRSFRLPRHGDGELLSSVFGRKSKEASTQQDSSAHQNVRHHNNVQGDWRHLQWIV